MPVKKASDAIPNYLLRRARQERGWTQQELADLIEAPQYFMINRWENGTAFPGPGYRKKLCTLFGKSPAELGLLKQNSVSCTSTTFSSICDPSLPWASPQALVGRDALLHQLKERLLVKNAPLSLALTGLPGAGKTAIALALAHDPEVRESFADGIVWACLRTTDVMTHMQRWCHLLRINQPEEEDVQAGDDWTRRLYQRVRNRRILFVLDDVSTIETALALKFMGPHCACILTTRKPEVAVYFAGNQVIHVPELGMDAGTQLLKQLASPVLDILPTAACRLVHAVDGLPLALILMGKYLLVQGRHQQQRRLQRIVEHLCYSAEARLRISQPQSFWEHDARFPINAPISLEAVIALSEAELDDNARQMLVALSVFPARPATFSEEAALSLTGASTGGLEQLLDAGLLESVGDDCYQLHQTIIDYANIALAKDKAALKSVAC